MFYVRIKELKDQILENSILIFKDLSKRKTNERLVFSKDQREKLLANLSKESKLYHKKFGHGKMLKIENDLIYIDFNGEEKLFSYPQVFVKGFISILD